MRTSSPQNLHCGFLTFLVGDCNWRRCLDVHIVSQFCCRLRVLPREVRRTVKLKQFLPDTLMKTVKVGQIRMQWTIGLDLSWLCTSVFCYSFVSSAPNSSHHRFFSLLETVNPLFHIYCVIDWKCVINQSYHLFFISWLLETVQTVLRLSESWLIFIQTVPWGRIMQPLLN